MTAADPVVIVGAGPTGLVLAMYLARKGLPVEILERYHPASPASGQGNLASSINLTICERGFAALEEVDLATAVRVASVPAYGRRFHLEDGTLAYQPYGAEGEALFAITRSDLTRLLLDIAERRHSLIPRFGERCVEVDPSRPAVHVQDSLTGACRWIEASAVIGADGAFSAVRRSLVSEGNVVDSLERATVVYKQLDVISSGGWTDECNALHIWPRGAEMMLAIPNADGSFTAAVLLAAADERSDAMPATEAEVLEYFLARYPDAEEYVPSLWRDYRNRRAVPLVTVRCRPWCVGRILLVGDAAHGMFPSYGQGANAGFEDSALLDKCIDAYGGDWASAFADFEAVRHIDTDAIADLSQQHLMDLRSSMARPSWLLRAQVESTVARVVPHHYRPLYETIAFTTVPYAAAVAQDRSWAPLVDYLLTLDVMRNQPDSWEAEETVRSVVSTAGLIWR